MNLLRDIATASMLAIAALGITAPIASAAPDGVVLLSTIDPGEYPVCFEEDCSDQVGQTGMWMDQDTGDWYLEQGESLTYLVIDDTAL